MRIGLSPNPVNLSYNSPTTRYYMGHSHSAMSSSNSAH
nr:MAG TPA: hypothetical protein [Podoviridae sp. ctY3D12]